MGLLSPGIQTSIFPGGKTQERTTSAIQTCKL